MKQKEVKNISTIAREQTRDWNEDTHWPGQYSDYEFDQDMGPDQELDRKTYQKRLHEKKRKLKK